MERRIIAAAVVLLAAAPTAHAAQKVDIVIASTTDVHGRLRGWDYFSDSADSQRGLSRAATVVDSVRDANPGRVILVDAGDFLQGTPFAFAAARIDTSVASAVVAGMNAMHYDAVTIGNHEFNYGVPVLTRELSTAKFAVIAANVRGGPSPHAWRGWTMIERAGVHIALIGVTTPGSMLWDAENLHAAGMAVGAIAPAVATAAREARAAGADAVVVVAHAGIPGGFASTSVVPGGLGAENPMLEVAAEVPGIDLMVLGHTHREIADTTSGGVLITQPLNWAGSVSLAHLFFEKADGRWRIAAKHASIVRTVGHAEQAKVLAATERGHASARKYAAAVIGHTTVAWSSDSARMADTPIMDFMAETMRRVAGAQLATISAFSTDVRIPAGPVTVAKLAQLYPYENTLRAVRISGEVLKAFLERSAMYFRVTRDGNDVRVSGDPTIPGYNFESVTGVEYQIDLNRQLGDRIVGLSYRGKPVRENDTFTIALSNYRAEGSGGYAMLRGAPVVYDRNEDMRQLLIDEVTRRGSLNPSDYFTRNWKLIMPVASPAPAKATTIRIISTNDFHGALEARPDGNNGMRGGAAQVAAMIKRAERECSGSCASIWLDAGDEFQGTPASNLAFGRPVVDMFNALGLAAAVIGNHDFDWGQDTLRARMKQARYAMLAANVHTTDGGNVPWIRADTIIDRGGVKIGVVGIATTLTPSTTKTENVVGLRFDDPVATVNAHAKSLRARGADLVIVVEHDGAFCDRGTECRGGIIDLAQRLSEPVDAIVSGHTHSLVNTTVKGIPIVQAMSSGRAIGVIDLPVDRASRASTREDVWMVKTDSITPDPAIETMLRGATQSVSALVARPIATLSEDMLRRGEQYALGNLIADAQRVETHSDVAVMNNGGIRSDLHAGPLSYGTLFELQPFGNLLVQVTVRGKDLRAYIESFVARGAPRVHVSGIVAHFDLARPAGSRITSVSVGGAPLDDARQYTVAYTDFLATGGDGLGLANAAIKQVATGIVDLDALITYARAQPGGIIRPDLALRLVPASP